MGFGAGPGEDQPVERWAHDPDQRERLYCNAYTPSLRMRGMDF